MDMVKQKLLKVLLVSIRALVKCKPALGPTSSPDLIQNQGELSRCYRKDLNKEPSPQQGKTLILSSTNCNIKYSYVVFQN